MRLKKAVSVILCAVMSLAVLSGCGGGTPEIPNAPAVFYTVMFNTNGGVGNVPPQLVEKGQKAVEPLKPPSHATKRFLGWFRTDRAVGVWDFDADTVTADVTLYAGWGEYSSIDYESMIDFGEPGHIYFHYMRFKDTVDDYNNWCMWVWPLKSEGVMFEWSRFDESGAIVDVDTTVTYPNGGVEGNTLVDYTADPDMGFLIVRKDSMGGGAGMWVSDGSADTVILDVFSHARDDGSVHVFINQGEVSNYKFNYNDLNTIGEDPYEGLEPGEANSVVDIDSSVSHYNKAATSPEFLNNAGVGYSIQVASFADSNNDGMGDLRGIINRLDYLDETLNVDVLWLTPIQLSDSYHGYDVIDYYQIDPKFGTIADYRELLYKAHERGMKVLMDLVPNHSSANNVWFKKSAQLDPTYRSYYRWRHGDEYAEKDFWYPFSDTGYYFYGKFASSMPELNFDYQGTRDAIVDVALYWMAFGLDGFRVDAVKHIYNEGEYDADTKAATDVIHIEKDTSVTPSVDYSRNATKNVNFFKEFNARLKAVYPDAFIVGENFDGDPAKTSFYYQGMDSQFNFNFYYDMFSKGMVANGANGFAAGYEGNLNLYSAYRGDTAIDSPMTSNHDIVRLLNHSVSGSGADGEVNATNSATAINRAKVYAATVLTLPGLTWIYYGDELGMSGYKMPNRDDQGAIINNYHADRWIRQPFKWATDKTSDTTGYQFQIYTVEWDAYNKTLAGMTTQKDDPNSMLSHFATFTALKNDPVMLRGNFKALTTTNLNLFAFTRTYNGTTYYVFHNTSNAAITGFNSGKTNVVAASANATATSLPAYGSIVLS